MNEIIEPIDAHDARRLAAALANNPTNTDLLANVEARLHATNAVHDAANGQGVIDPAHPLAAVGYGNALAEALVAAADELDAEIADARKGIAPPTAPYRETRGRDLTDRMLGE
ncbi:Uncharacterised protein [Mycobacteroides abscessus subsp. abscessus]|uniref:hypothetical protein n=1 Tax=Mycobacteroides abscessus TaxID=36809 RepID=UPI000929B9E1|nr:hypothetical protein [Mycobacteroides abscessus]SIC63955.1 Uncharacterised protein [Mycobacteroides abscessus subsp. abscessus]SIG64914.1 Uncharacterised protein [Mycobacteroides abscessus subsp. abscessus]